MTATTTIAPPEPDLTAAELLARAQALVPVLRERQPATEAAGRLLDESHEAFAEAGLYRALQPRRFGGYELGLRDFVGVMSEISRGCPSSGWVLALTSGHPHLLSHWSEEAQAEIYGADGDARVPGRPVQPGLAIPTDGGYVVSGTWDYASGCDQATHFMGSAIVPGTEPPRLVWLLVDRADFEIVDNWDPIGLRGTGSKRVVCSDVLVPEHRVITAIGTSPERPPGWRSHANPLYAGGLFTSCSSSSAPSRSAPRAARSTSTRTSSPPSALDIPPFVLRGEVDEYQHHLGQAIGLRRPRRGGAARGGRPVHRPGDARLRRRRAGRRQRRGDAAPPAAPAAELHPAVRRGDRAGSSGPAGRAARATATRSATRCSR